MRLSASLTISRADRQAGGAEQPQAGSVADGKAQACARVELGKATG